MSTGKMPKFVVLCLAMTSTIAVGRAQSAKPFNEAVSVNGDGAQRSQDIHWPDGFHPEQADLFSHNEIVVHASCEKVFANMANAQAWPSWYPNSHNVKVLNSPDGRLHAGTRFSWDTNGHHVESHVHEFVPNTRIAWFGDAPELHGYHTYLLSETNEGCHVVTEEVAKGLAAIEFRKNRPQAMHQAHDLWLSTLKQRSEN